jgi:hypothetical protein
MNADWKETLIENMQPIEREKAMSGVLCVVGALVVVVSLFFPLFCLLLVTDKTHTFTGL